MSSDDVLLPTPPRHAVEGGVTRYGRYRSPIPMPNLSAPGRLGRMRLKQWHYMSVVAEECFLAFGLVQLGYLANAFCYLVDRRDGGGNKLEYEALSPMGAGLRVAPSSVEGVTSFRKGDARVEVRWDGGWVVDLALPLGGEPLQASYRALPGESLALLHELPTGQPAYTHKAAGLPASGSIRFRGEDISLDDGLAVLDWTRSVASRETRWKWASFASRLPDGRTVGLNLSAEVYDDGAGNSQENALWVDGRVRPLGGVRFELPEDPERQPWHIRSREGDEVELEFRPLGARAQRMDVKLVKSDFVQPYGTFHGRIETLTIDGAFGVVEDHLSVW